MSAYFEEDGEASDPQRRFIIYAADGRVKAFAPYRSTAEWLAWRLDNESGFAEQLSSTGDEAPS